jgi:hypothetical protein
MDAGEREPWERRADETSHQYLAFRRFRDLGVTRSLRSLTGTPPGRRLPGNVERWATRHRWRERAAAWDDELFRIEDDARLESISGSAALDLPLDP